jgi:hypothetical protein
MNIIPVAIIFGVLSVFRFGVFDSNTASRSDSRSLGPTSKKYHKNCRFPALKSVALK